MQTSESDRTAAAFARWLIALLSDDATGEAAALHELKALAFELPQETARELSANSP